MESGECSHEKSLLASSTRVAGGSAACPFLALFSLDMGWRSWTVAVVVLVASFLCQEKEAVAKELVCRESPKSSLQRIPSLLGGERGEAIHRFFDSSPVSSSGQYLALTQIPAQSTGRASVLLANLHDLSKPNAVEAIANTTAWGAQVGAHVQWAGNHLFFNVEHGGPSERTAHGVRFDPATKTFTPLPCPVYHVSNDGTFAASPNLYKIRFTQLGYGIDHGMSPMERLDTTEDGVFVTNVSQGTCRLQFSLRTIANAIGIPSTQTRLYGFHTKWSFDNRWILFVLRTLEKPSQLVDQLLSTKRVRVQHLVLLSPTHQTIRYVLSWASKPFQTVDGHIVHLLDGNHPNWMPHAHSFSMNLAPRQSGDWHTVVFDVDDIPDKLPLFHQRLQWSPFSPSASRKSQASLTVRVAWRRGMGHPSFHKDGRRFVTDVYEKERGLCVQNHTRDIPVLLVDALQGDSRDEDREDEVWVLARIPLLQARMTRSRSSGLWTGSKREDRSRRCDLHPAWVLDYTAVVVNVCTPLGRQAAIIGIA